MPCKPHFTQFTYQSFHLSISVSACELIAIIIITIIVLRLLSRDSFGTMFRIARR